MAIIPDPPNAAYNAARPSCRDHFMFGVDGKKSSAQQGKPAPEADGNTARQSPESGELPGGHKIEVASAGMPVDVDEAASGFAYFARLVQELFQRGIRGIQGVFLEQGTEMRAGDVLAEASIVLTPANVALGTVVPWAAAGLAIHGAVSDASEAREEHRRLLHERRQLQEKRAETATAADVGAPTLSAQVDQRRLREIRERIGAVKLRLATAASTACAGVAMVLQGSVNLVTMVLSRVLPQALPAIVSALGAAGGMVLAVGFSPLASLATLVMTSTLVVRSRKAYQALREVIGHPDFTGNMAATGNAVVAGYLRFLKHKAHSSADFLRGLRNRCILLLSGTALLTGGVLAKTGLVIAGALGLLAMANPVGLAVGAAVLGTATAVGGLVLVVGSLSVMWCGKRNKRLEAMQEAGHPLLDTGLMRLLDAGEKGSGLTCRATAHALLTSVECATQQLLVSEANRDSKQYVFKQVLPAMPATSGDYREIRAALGESPVFEGDAPSKVRKTGSGIVATVGTLLTNLGAAWSAVRHVVARIAAGDDFRLAREEAKDRFAERRASLSLRRLASRLNDNIESMTSAVNGMIASVLEAQENYWNGMSDLASAFRRRTNPSEKDAANLRKHERAANAMAGRILALRAKPDLHEFLALQAELGLTTFDADKKYDDKKLAEAARNEALANFLIRDLPDSLKQLRGVLFASEVSAVRDAIRTQAGRDDGASGQESR